MGDDFPEVGRLITMSRHLPFYIAIIKCIPVTVNEWLAFMIIGKMEIKILFFHNTLIVTAICIPFQTAV